MTLAKAEARQHLATTTAVGTVLALRSITLKNEVSGSVARTLLEPGKVVKVGGTQVLGPQGAAVANATDSASAITQLNALLARLRAHGLIAS